MKTPIALTLPALLLAGCAKDTHVYPSLAPRPAEAMGFAEPEVKVVEAKPDPALDARIATMARTLDGIARGFAADAEKAEAAGRRAKGAAVGSEAWLNAQTALAQLDDWRAQASSLLTDIDQAAADRAGALLPAYPALVALRESAATESERESLTIDRLQAALPAA